MIRDQVSVLASRTANQRRTKVVRLFRNVVAAALGALLAGEGELVGGLFSFTRGDFGCLV